MLLELDHIEFFVGNAYQSAMFYKAFFNFDIVAKKKTSLLVSYVVMQEKIKIVFTSSLVSESKIANHVKSHGDSVKAITFKVSDSKKIWERLIMNGANSAFEPKVDSDNSGSITMSGIKVYGEVIHILLDRDNYEGVFLPGYDLLSNELTSKSVNLFSTIDHYTAVVEEGNLNTWVDYYKKVFGFSMCFSTESFTKGNGMKAKVVKGEAPFLFPITEPFNSPNNISQFQKFLNYNNGPGVQHLSFTSKDIIRTIRELRKRGIETLKVPKDYYLNIPNKTEILGINLDDLKDLNILVEKDDNGFLFQAFTIPLLDRPTFFIEIIQRKGANLFGKGNVNELFKALTKYDEQ